MEVFSPEIGKLGERIGSERKIMSPFGHSQLEMPRRHPGGDVQWIVGEERAEFRGEGRVGLEDLGVIHKEIIAESVGAW